MKRETIEDLSARLSQLENEVQAIKARLPEEQHPSDSPWYLKKAGLFKDAPEFAEIVRLGREIRQADRPA